MKSIVILISGRGSNMQAILEARLPVKIAAVISSSPNAHGLEIARQHGIPAHALNHRDHETREEFDTALAAKINEFNPDLVVLAGFMRILTPKFVHDYNARLINIHPSLLPAFTGLNTHARALTEGVKIHGCTVHFVTPNLDKGPIIVQAAVPVLPGDTEETLGARVLEQEHQIYPQAIRWFAEDRLTVTPDCNVILQNQQPVESALRSPWEAP
ncbi:phosphoribosylglycinamide formyltransferase [Sulfuricella denitrificans skB26]|uniref:Phosphoribosylglycinamide formyltransferase n=1 Tax=Sulfuricella denitrificans (strain DSM 22764 / NBRC 105220 / skB26) TaxID=1163617 RepID=S6AAQ8_SULDS|nr:phosphoribosylglycinamide formyltransferase [Sulfuricella denitrificans]BAN36165.1 phosphoribosylglycinamide formyltransferase [Sulfuricella denitrificans skB26]